MLSSETVAGSPLCSQDEGNTSLSTRHKAILGCLIDDLIHRQAGKINKQDLYDRTHTDNGGANRHADKGSF